MRNLTITRRKSFVGCAMKDQIYIRDALAQEIIIDGVPCRKLGDIKNGESKTFQIEDGEQQNDTITVGSLVTVKDIEFDEITEYRLVGTVEADPMNNRISNESPVGRALLGHKAGEIIEVEAPVGVIKLEIVEVSRG